MGDQLRFTPEGPRELLDRDYRSDVRGVEGDSPKVIRNDESHRITAKATFDPIVDPERHQELLAKLDKRGGSQRGVPRSRNPDLNPLGTRIYDLTCGWPLYRQAYEGSFRYLCGLYQEGGSDKCNHNVVKGPQATQFVLSCIRQRALAPGRLEKIQARIHELVAAEAPVSPIDNGLAQKEEKLADIVSQCEQVSENLARATSDEQFQAVSKVFERLQCEATDLRQEIEVGQAKPKIETNADEAVEMAMDIIQQMQTLAKADEKNLGAARQLFDLFDAKLYVDFHKVKKGKRTLNKVKGGMVRFGESPPPIKLYEGPTGRRHLRGKGAKSGSQAKKKRTNSDQSDESLGKISQGERLGTKRMFRSPPTADLARSIGPIEWEQP